jgi:hypothetical protein
VTVVGGPGRASRWEHIARSAVGMPALHPELLTCKPGRAEWELLAT